MSYVRVAKQLRLRGACVFMGKSWPLAVSGPLSGAHVCRYWAFTFGSVRRSSGHTRLLRLFRELRFRSAIGGFPVVLIIFAPSADDQRANDDGDPHA